MKSGYFLSVGLNKGKLGKNTALEWEGHEFSNIWKVWWWIVDKNVPATSCLPQGAGAISEEAKIHNYGKTT